jgi:hypothetical protein
MSITPTRIDCGYGCGGCVPAVVDGGCCSVTGGVVVGAGVVGAGVVGA